MNGELEKLELRQVIKGKPNNLYIEVFFDPGSLKEEQQIGYCDEKVTGSVGAKMEFTSMPASVMTFQFMLDGTGDNLPKGVKIASVPDLVEKVKKITQDYDGGSHEPPVVELTWGSNVIRGRTTKLDIEYNLFKRTGEPLRAVVSLEVECYSSRGEERKTKKRNVPDLTHIISVKAGDRLSLLCHQIYTGARDYIDIALHNNIRSFRKLVPLCMAVRR